MTENLITWLRAQLNKDERLIAEHPDEADGGTLVEELGLSADTETNYPCWPYLRIAKKRAAAEVAAKRAILDLHQQGDKADECFICFGVWPCGTLRTLALPYADRPGYRPEWAPPNG